MKIKLRFKWLNLFMSLGYAFLYLPILFVIVYSFNKAKRGHTWTGFTLDWYKAMVQNDQLLDALTISLIAASISATLAVILGTTSAAALARFKHFHGKTLFGLMTAAPLVMPEVITGLAILLLFVSMEQIIGWPAGRGLTTIVIAHTTLAMAYVVLIVRARLTEMDTSLEEAALDLGAKPLAVFMTVTLPVISPALISGWLLSFALSLDDLVLASFTSGPGSSTLPMVIFANIKFNLTPEINALATLIITAVAATVVLAGYFLYRKK